MPTRSEVGTLRWDRGFQHSRFLCVPVPVCVRDAPKEWKGCLGVSRVKER